MQVSNGKTNNGRSMIEMLGVLALMAILSLVGVYMLQRSMLVHRTNQLVEDMRLAGMVVLDGLYDDLTTQEMSIKGHFEQQTPYNFAAAMESDTLNTFYVIAKGVPFDVCIEVKNRKPQWAEQIVANDEQDTCLENQDNDMGFFFNDELVELADACRKDSDCGHCSQCVNNRCKYGFKNQSGNCFSCDDASNVIWSVGEEECHRCKNWMWSNRGRCIKRPTISGEAWAYVSSEECVHYPHYYPTSCGNEYCFYCAGVFDPSTGVCNTSRCLDNPVSGATIFGMDRNTCTGCGGRYGPRSVEGGIVGICWF